MMMGKPRACVYMLESSFSRGMAAADVCVYTCFVYFGAYAPSFYVTYVFSGITLDPRLL